VFVLGILGLAVAVTAAMVTGRWYWKRRVERWARDQGYSLVSFKGARFFEGPGRWRRNENMFTFRIVVRDSAGSERLGWLTFGSFWSFWPTSRVDVRWGE
jgi:hypothetical protein